MFAKPLCKRTDKHERDKFAETKTADQGTHVWACFTEESGWDMQGAVSR